MRVFVRRNGNKLRDYVWRRKRTGGVFDGNKQQRRSKESWKAVINKRKTVNRAGGNEAFRWCLCFFIRWTKGIWFYWLYWYCHRFGLIYFCSTELDFKAHHTRSCKKSMTNDRQEKLPVEPDFFSFDSIIKLWHGGQN